MALRLFLISDNNLTLDDLYTITITSQPSFAEAWTKKILTEPHPPLFNIVVYIWCTIFSDSVLSLRGLSAAISFISLYYIYKDGSHILPKNAFILYFSLAALTPVAVSIFLSIRPYTFYYPASMLAILYFISLVKDKADRCNEDTVKFVFWALIAALSHYFGMALVFFQIFYLASLTIIRKNTIFSIRNYFLLFPVVVSLLWFIFHIYYIKNNQIATTWIYPTGLKYCIGYLQLIFGGPIPRIASSNDPQSFASIMHNLTELLNVVAVCVPVLAVILLLIFKGKAIFTHMIREHEEKAALLAAGYLAAVPFTVFFVIGRIIPIVNWKYMMGYIPSVWMVIALSLGAAKALRPAAVFFLGALFLSSLLFFPGLLSIPRYQIGDALQTSAALSKKMDVPLVLPDLIEYRYFFNKEEQRTIIWRDIDRDEGALPDAFITVAGHCTPTDNVNAQNACIRADRPILKRYTVEKVWRFALAGIYRLRLKP